MTRVKNEQITIFGKKKVKDLNNIFLVSNTIAKIIIFRMDLKNMALLNILAKLIIN